LTAEEAKDIYRIRAVLQGLAAHDFVENADEHQHAALRAALEAVIAAYDAGDAERTVATKTEFYERLYSGAASETLSSMLATLHARMWRWRALGIAHPLRSEERSHESVENLRAIVAAIARGDGDEAERITRLEASQAAEEVLRLLAADDTETAQRMTATKETRA
jgi:DNA-binding GntR family transcriptional regulator